MVALAGLLNVESVVDEELLPSLMLRQDSSTKTCDNITYFDTSDYFKGARLAVHEVR
jgi:hypothetical protein